MHFRPAARSAPVHAQADDSYLYVEPQTTMLRKPDGSQQVEGKLVIDMRNRDVWGLPTLSGLGLPYQAASCLGTDLSRPI